ncbi:MAG: hypothetical protein HS117_12940 [Verrucomicrobiaceae bacterium]|nr:hypothetical protein [Verrucomicrobiaceae bacterium]
MSTARQRGGFTSVELLLVLALGAVVIGGAVVSYGSIVRSQPRVSSFITVPLGSTRMQHFYGSSNSTLDTASAPQFGGLSQAEELREQFLADVMSATAVFCLPRDDSNAYKPSIIAYNPLQHAELDTPQKFRAHLVSIGAVTAAQYRDYRNPLNDGVSVPQNASIFVLGFSKYAGYLKVLSLYDIDVIRFTGAGQPQGFHASVKRYADPVGSTTPSTLTYAGGYDVFYPPSVFNASNPAQWATDGFSPLFVTFERAVRLALTEAPSTIQRFKRAAERSFYLIWWPDPCARHLGPVTNTLPSSDPRQAYNQNAGRTSFMFTVPMFPAL